MKLQQIKLQIKTKNFISKLKKQPNLIFLSLLISLFNSINSQEIVNLNVLIPLVDLAHKYSCKLKIVFHYVDTCVSGGLRHEFPIILCNLRSSTLSWRFSTKSNLKKKCM